MASTGFCYLIELEKPLGSDAHSARYYLGWAADPYARLNHHRKGNGSAMLRAAVERGIRFDLVAVIPGTRADERRYKKQHHHARLARQWQRRMAVAQ